MFQSRLSPRQWAEARLMRSEGATYALIGKSLGVRAATISCRARKEGWDGAAKADRSAKAVARRKRRDQRATGLTASIRARIALRLFSVIDTRLAIMEHRMHKQLERIEADSDAPAAGEEADTSQLGTLIKTIDQVMELDPDLARAAEGGAKSTDSDAHASEADAFRREIAERIEKLIAPS
jgi:uncharacterized protein YjcR